MSNSLEVDYFQRPTHRIIVNTIPHCGTHLVSSILEELGYSHATYWSIRHGKVKVGLNWRLSNKLMNFGASRKNTDVVPVSVASPRPVKMSLIKHYLGKVGPAEYLLSHAPYSDTLSNYFIENSWKGFLIIRDPRDMCLSMINHIRTRPQHMAHKYLFEVLNTESERINAIVRGFDNSSSRGIVSISQMYDSVMGWEKSPNFVWMKFEDLVGGKGGGDNVKQREGIVAILQGLGIDFSRDEEKILDSIGGNAYGNSSTFRKGQIGGWRDKLDDSDKQVFREYANELLLSLGYEDDPDWV